jgi:3D (Asp-Asp-Asp) domain-containing protein
VKKLLVVVLLLIATSAFANPAVGWADRVQSDPCQPAVKKEFAKVIVSMDEPPTGWTFKFLPVSTRDVPYGGAAADPRFYPVGTVLYIPPPIDGIRVVTLPTQARLGRTLFMPEITRQGYLKGVVPLGQASVEQVLQLLLLWVHVEFPDPEGDRV